MLQPLNNLMKLNLAGTAITDAGVAALNEFPLLQVLDLRRTNVSMASVATLQGMSSLRKVRLKNSAIPVNELTALKTTLPL